MMGRKPLKYQHYVEPHHPMVVALCSSERFYRFAGDLESLADAVIDWVTARISHVQVTDTLYGVEDTLVKRRGTCFSVACLVCSIFRHLGFQESYVGFLSLPHRDFESMLHATTLVRIGKSWYLVDGTSDTRWKLVGSLESVSSEFGQLLALFNDNQAWVPELVG